jgi:hypothetical protein
MCFTFNTAEAVIEGAYCVSYASSDSESVAAAADSRTVSFLTAAQWDGNYNPATGTELTNGANGLVNTPDDTAGDATAHTAGNSIVASWF